MATIVEFQVKRPSKMRYKTVGDWYYEGDDDKKKAIIVTVDTGHKYMNMCLLIHELVEQTLCEAHGVSQEQVDAFDLEHEDEQGDIEIGDLEAAPYHKEHMIASIVEQIMVQAFPLSWQKYNEIVDARFEEVYATLKEKEDN